MHVGVTLDPHTGHWHTYVDHLAQQCTPVPHAQTHKSNRKQRDSVSPTGGHAPIMFMYIIDDKGERARSLSFAPPLLLDIDAHLVHAALLVEHRERALLILALHALAAAVLDE